jgi:radical SAM protein with 4Fe4S-binding SPASM domain
MDYQPMNFGEKGSAFCILPWLHFNLQTNGDIYACCDIERNENSRLGNLNQNTFEEVWNRPNLRALRVRMLNNIQTSECRGCYETESTGGISKRLRSNQTYKDHLPMVEKTRADGGLDDVCIRDMALHFANTCNFRCRTCGPESSSSWAQEIKMMAPDFFYKNQGYEHFKNKSQIANKLIDKIDHLETVYFAGGEPLLIEDHYRFLSALIEKKMYHTRLVYNTNFSDLYYKEYDLLKMWRLFPRVYLSISLDLDGTQGEYLRKGLRWENIYKNREELRAQCPHVEVEVNATLSVFNVLRLPEFHRELVLNNFIKINAFTINYLFTPNYFSAQILPDSAKKLAKIKYAAYDQHLRLIQDSDGINTDFIRNAFASAIQFVCHSDESHLLRAFREHVDQVDSFRSESFEKIFPELNALKASPTDI